MAVEQTTAVLGTGIGGRTAEYAARAIAMSRVMLALLRFYRLRISTHTRPSCRFVPSCSEYATEAIERYGAVRGGALAVWRVLRCNPLSKGGYDPVPKYYS